MTDKFDLQQFSAPARTPAKPLTAEVYVPRGAANDEANLFAAVNGRSYILPRGKRSVVPLAVAQELMRCAAAQEAQDRRIDELMTK